MLEVAIVGGGLAGLSLATELSTKTWALFEANDRFGGRIFSTPAISGDKSARFDLGPTWIWPHNQPRLRQLVQHYGIQLFPQFQAGDALYMAGRAQPPQRYPDPQGYQGAYRVQGGAQCLVEALEAQLSPESVFLDHRLTRLTDRGDHVELGFETQGKSAIQLARKVVLCLPPRLLANNLVFEPAMEPKLKQLMLDTPTWMAGHGKMVLQYERPFWREQGLSGNAFAPYPGALLGEIFDACNSTGTVAALGGFFALPAAIRQQYPEDLAALAMAQLFYFFGQPATKPIAVYQQDWHQQNLTAVAADEFIPAAHPVYGHQWLRLDHWGEKLWFGATETDPQFGGYLEGALSAAARVAADLNSM